jgi:serine phosphatase RsbU (regulator of sigma subunit)/catechol 2,3-dioxygenase-like lactoylglutathione lyase family enzyme
MLEEPRPHDTPAEYGWLRDQIVSVETPSTGPGGPNRFTSIPVNGSQYLRLQFVNVYVRDQERSRRFFVEQLGFSVNVEVRFASGNRWIQVSPPDGTASLALVLPRPELGEEDGLVGNSAPITFLAEDVEGIYREWSKRGVRFTTELQKPMWGGTFCRFEDPDGNAFALAGFDEASREIEKLRREQAQREDAERRAAQELEIARQVQARLFPQQKPEIAWLDYDGACVQARAVGGDYFDYLHLDGGLLGLVVGDIAGKGMPAALLMANLQAAIRSISSAALNGQAATGSLPLDRFLAVVNRVLFQNTETAAYATLVFVELNPPAGRIRYVNCGHVPAFLVRRDGTLERLGPTGTVLGLFETWDCAIGETSFAAGDTLALCSDGITEAESEEGLEFGDEGLIRALRSGSGQSARELVRSITNDVMQFSRGERHDDITLIVARFLETENVGPMIVEDK